MSCVVIDLSVELNDGISYVVVVVYLILFELDRAGT